MKRVIPTILLVAFVLSLQAQNPLEVTSANNIVPLPSSRSLSATQLAGKILFVQRCSVCHLPGPIYKPYGPLLDGKLIAFRGEAAEREQIMQGTLRMPGWQYALEPKEIDNILAYLKTLVYDPAAQKYTYSSTKP